MIFFPFKTFSPQGSIYIFCSTDFFFFIFSVFLHRTLIKRSEKKKIFPGKIFCCWDILNMKREGGKDFSLPDLKMPNYERQFNAFSICFQINGYQIYYKRNSLLKKNFNIYPQKQLQQFDCYLIQNTNGVFIVLEIVQLKLQAIYIRSILHQRAFLYFF